MLIVFLVIFLLVVLNGLFVAAEFAILGASRPTIDRLATDGNAAARAVRRILRDARMQDRYIVTAQLGITFASLGLGMYGEHALAEWIADGLATVAWIPDSARWIASHAFASVVSVGLLTYVHIVVGEMVPKSLALMYAERTALWVTRPMQAIKMVLFPLVVALNGISNAFLRLVGIRRELSSSQSLTTDELQFIVEESRAGGKLRAESGRVVRELFDFAELKAREVMVPRVHVVGMPLDADGEQMVDVLRKDAHTRYPVYAGDLDHVVGVVHIKDILRLLKDREPLTTEHVREAAFVPETAELDRVLDAMRQARTQLVVVIDEHGGTTGIVTIEDLCEEVVGEIEEDEDGVPELVRDEGGRLLVAGTIRVDELGEALGLSLEHEDVDTVSGLILALLERPPQRGDAVTWEGLRFEVLEVDGLGVGRCAVEVEPAPEQPAE